MATLQDIQTSLWQIGLQGFGYVVEGISCLRQRIILVLTTSRGTDPLRPEFGSNIYKWLDKPMQLVIPGVKADIVEAIGLWMPEIVINKITHKLIDVGWVQFEIVYGVADSDLRDVLLLNIGNGIIVNPKDRLLIITGYIPANQNSLPYRATLVLNGDVVFPLCPLSGFETIALLFEWIVLNWGFAGQWYLSSDKITCYVKDPAYKTGSLTISLVDSAVIKRVIPVRQVGEQYRFSLIPSPDADPVEPDVPFVTSGDLLLYLQNNWGQYGDWTIERHEGSFSGEFSGDFDVFVELLVLVTSEYREADFTIATF